MYDEEEGRIVGEQGVVTTRILGGEHPGEVQIPLRGGSESFIAFCPERIERGARILVIGRRPGRALDVTMFDGELSLGAQLSEALRGTHSWGAEQHTRHERAAGGAPPEEAVMFGWHVPSPDEAMLISGGRGANGLPFKIVTGHGAFVLPFKSRVSFLTLSMQEAEVAEECVTKQGIAVNVKAVIAFKVGADFEGIASAAQRFLDDEGKMSVLTGRVFAGHLRSIIGSMTVEEIIRERQRLAEEALDASKIEMSRIGLVVDALQIESIDDMGSGYIASLAAPHVAAVRQNARIAQAQADQASAEAEQASLRNQAEYERQTAIAKAGFKAETDKAQSTAGQAGPLAQAQAEQEVLEAQTALAERNAKLRQQQLVAEVVRPAEADAQRVKIAAGAEAEKIRQLAEAAAANNRVSLDQQMIAQLPEMLRAAAEGLQGASLTVLNGSDGLGELISGLASQGIALYDTLRTGVGSHETTGPASSAGTAVAVPEQ